MKLFTSDESKEDANAKKSNSTENSSDTASSFLSSKLSSGPIGLGDPNDRTLRKVETEVMIPKIVRERSKALKCANFKEDFDKCCLDNAMMMVVHCRDENRRYQECMAKWFHDKDFVSECTEIYLQQRAEFRRTGVKQNPRAKKQQEKLLQQQKDANMTS